MNSKEHDLCEAWIGDSPLRIVIENTDGFRAYERRAIEYLLQSPVFGLTWDIGHSKATGERDVPFLLAHEDRLLPWPGVGAPAVSWRPRLWRP